MGGLLIMGKFFYNSSFHIANFTTPFKLMFECGLMIIQLYVIESFKHVVVDHEFATRYDLHKKLRSHLLNA